MRQTILIGFFFMAVLSVCGQSASDSIKVKEGSGTVFQQNGEKLSPQELLSITESNNEAHKEMEIAKINYDVGMTLGFTGGFLVGWPFGRTLTGGDFDWSLAGAGAALIIAGLPFNSSYKKHAKEAARIYNSGFYQAAANKTELNIGLTSHGVGLTVSF